MIPRFRRSPGEGNGNPLQYLAWKTPWTEELGGLQPMASQTVRHDLVAKQQRDRTGAVGPFLNCVPRSSRSEFTFSRLYYVDLLSRQAYRIAPPGQLVLLR